MHPLSQRESLASRSCCNRVQPTPLLLDFELMIHFSVPAVKNRPLHPSIRNQPQGIPESPAHQMSKASSDRLPPASFHPSLHAVTLHQSSSSKSRRIKAPSAATPLPLTFALLEAGTLGTMFCTYILIVRKSAPFPGSVPISSVLPDLPDTHSRNALYRNQRVHYVLPFHPRLPADAYRRCT